MSETIIPSLLRLSETGGEPVLSAEAARPLYGPDFERLLARRVLVEQAPISDWEICDDCDCGLPCRPLRPAGGDAFRAECPLDPRRDVVLGADDLRSFRISPPELALQLALVAWLKGPLSEIAEGLWHLGVHGSGREIFLTFSIRVATQEGIASLIRRAAPFGRWTLLAPRLPAQDVMRLAEADVHVVETLAVLSPAPTGLDAAIDAAALAPSPHSPALHFNASTGEARVRGRGVALSHQLAPVFLRLVQKAVSRHPVASGPEVEGESGREAKDLIRELREAFKAGGLSDAEAKALIVNVRNRGWRVGPPAAEIVLEA